MLEDGALLEAESVYDLLPKELQLQPSSSSKTDTPTMSQKSGGEARPPPSASLASDAISSTSSPSPSSSQDMGDPCTTSPRPSTAPSTSSMKQPQSPLLLHHPSSAPGEGSGAPGGSQMQGVEGALSALGGGSCSGTSSGTGDPGAAGGVGAQQQPQNTPSKRRPVLSISPPPEDLFDDSNMSCQEDPAPAGPAGPDSEYSSSIWADDSASNFSLLSSSSYNDNTEVPRKSRKRTPRQRPGPKPSPPEDSMDMFDADSAKAPHFVLSLEAGCLLKGCILSGQYPQKSEGKELKILLQPETQHRARYLTEGSRGSVKDRTQQGFPTVKLEGVSEPVVLQVFVASDTGRVKPHGFYQACRVTGRNTKACKEVDIEGTTVIEIPLEPSNAMSLAVDCVGILKLRNADVEARIGVAGSKKKSTRARLAFRVNIPQPDGSVLTLQTTSSPILCMRGGEELFIIGKNFLKGTKVIFQENTADDNSWQAEAEIDMELFHQNHVIVKVPPYHNLSVSSPVSVGVYIMTNAGRSHDVQPFTYTPDSEHSLDMSVKTEGSSLAKACTFQDQIKSLASDPAQSAGELVKRQEVTPMEVSSNTPSTALFKPSSDALVSVQQTLALSSSTPPSAESFPSPMPLQHGDVDFPQSPVFPSLEPLCTIQKQDIAPTTSFPVSSDNTTLPPVPPELPQQFLRDPQESLPQDASNPSSEVVLVGMSQDGVAQLERAVRELQAGGSDLVQQVMEAAVAQQQLNSVLYSPTASTDSLQQHQLFQSPRPLSETPSPQHQVQAALLQNTLTVLTSGSLSQEQQATGSTLFLSPNTLSNQGSQQQLAFLSSMETSACEPQTVSVFQPQTQQQQQSTPMDQQQSPQQTQLQQTQQLPMAQQGSLFQTSTLPPSQHPQPQPTGLLLCTASLKPQALPPALLFSTQAQGPSMGSNSTPRPQDAPASLLFSQPTMVGVRVGVAQTDPAEPMFFQDQSSSVGGTPASSNPPPQGLFQGQQPMQVGSSSVSGPPSQQVELFLPQGSLSGLQGSMATQELGNQAAAGATIFVMQSGLGVVGLQSTTSSPGKRPPEQLFQTGVSGNVGQPGGQPNLFVFGLQNDSSQLMTSSGPTMSAQSQSQNPNPLQASHIQPLLDPNMAQTATPMHTNLQTPMQTGLQNAMSSLENALQANLQTPMQTNIQTEMQTNIQTAIETTPMQTNLQTPMQTNLQTPMQTNLQTPMQTNLQTPMQTNFQTPMQTSLQTPMQSNMQTSMSTSQNMEKIEDLLESLQEQ
ncbi:unnamed protein product [Coregonus sp. 'balchen']|nr:unnamed protein product [Coregonus sp. 'balchen']